MSEPDSADEPSLAETQELFWRAITWPTGVADFLEQSDEATRSQFHRVFDQSPDFPRSDRLEVYAESYYYRLEGVLREQFPNVAYLLGPERFHNLCTDYVLACPSENPDVRHYGDRFEAFVRNHDVETVVPGLSEIAAIEQAIAHVIDAPNEPALTVPELASVPPEDWPALRFEPRRTTHLFSCRWDYAAISRAMRNNASIPEPETPGVSGLVLVWRRGLEGHHRNVPAGEGAALQALLAGNPFAMVCEAATAASAEVTPEQVAAWLVGWVRSELLRGIASGD